MIDKQPTHHLPEYDEPPDKDQLGFTFEDIRGLTKTISDQSIIDIMRGDLVNGNAEKVYLIKSWLDQVASDESDVDFTHNPDKIIQFRDQLSDFVVNRLYVHYDNTVGSDTRRYIEKVKEKFIQQTISHKEDVANFVRYKNDRNKRPRYEVAEFNGFSIQTTGGPLDLISQGLGNSIRTNICVQNPGLDLFVRYDSEQFMKARASGQNPLIKHRIYLNPRIEDTLIVFNEIVDLVEKSDLTMRCKVLDRLASSMSPDAARGVGEFNIRADGILLYAGDDIDALLSIANDVFKNHPDSFMGRKMPRVPHPIGDGVAVGDEPSEGSLTSHRADLLEKVKQESLKELGQDTSNPSRVITVFREVYAKLAKRHNVNPNNIAFNAD